MYDLAKLNEYLLDVIRRLKSIAARSNQYEPITVNSSVDTLECPCREICTEVDGLRLRLEELEFANKGDT